MSKKLIFVIFPVFALLLFLPAYGGVVISDIIGMNEDSTVSVGSVVQFVFTVENDIGNDVNSFTNGFKIWSKKNSQFSDNFSAIVADTFALNWENSFDLATGVSLLGADGQNEDTVVFFGLSSTSNGWPVGHNQEFDIFKQFLLVLGIRFVSIPLMFLPVASGCG